MADDSWRQQDSFLLKQVEKTAAQVRRVEWFATFAQLATIALACFLGGILLDHWCFSKGLSVELRVGFFSLSITLLVFAFLCRIVPLLRRRVNPLFAASILEGERGRGKNFVINWFLLRDRKGVEARVTTPIHQAVMQGVVDQANDEVLALPEDSLVDHTPVIRWGILFTSLLALFSIYTVLSPKNPITSVKRLLLPTAKIGAPLSVRFLDIRPGNTTIFAGDYVEVVAEIAGVGKKPVFFSWTTDDKRLVDRTVPMEQVAPNRYSLRFPAADGLLEPVSYRVLVGTPDKSENYSPSYRIDVRQPLSITAEQVRLVFPDYTRTLPVILQNTGDIRALRGTTVELVAKANVPLEAAFFIPQQKESLARTMIVDPTEPERATLTFTPRKEDDGPTQDPVFADHDTWSMLCRDQSGNMNRTPSVYSIEMYDDLPPVITWELVPNGLASVPENGSLTVKVRAEDPDFGLDRVTLTIVPRRQQGVIAEEEEPRIIELLPLPLEKPLGGEHVLTGTIRPSDLKLKVGSEYEYRVVAMDAKTPEPNRSAVPVKLFVVTPPSRQGKEQSPPDKDAEQKEDSQKTNGQGTSSTTGEKSSDGKQEGEKGSPQGQDAPKEGGGNDSETGSEGESSPKSDSKNGSGGKEGEKGKGQQGQNQGGSESQDKNPGNQQGQKGDAKQEGAESKEGAESGQAGEGTESESKDQTGQNGQASPNHGKGGEAGSQGGADVRNKEESAHSQKTDPQGKQGENNGSGSEAKEGQQSPSDKSEPSSQPIDPEANPGDAFEKILEHMNKMGQGTSKEERKDHSDSSGQGSGNRSTRAPEQGKGDPSKGTKPSDIEDDAKRGKEKASPSSEKTDPEEQADGSPHSSSDTKDGKQVKGRSPDELPQGLDRQKGDVSPDSKDYMTRQADGKLPAAEKPLEPGAKVVDDPDRKVTGEKTDATSAGSQTLKAKDREQLGKNPEQAERGHSEKGKNSSQTPESMDVPEVKPDSEKQQSAHENPDGVASSPSKSAKHSKQDDQGSQGSPDAAAKEESNDSSSTTGGDGAKKGSETPMDPQQVSGGHASSSFAQSENATELADDPNIQYTEQATNLVLEYLEDQVKGKVDPRLLDKLGWTEDQVKQFLKKWQEMKKNAKKSDITDQERVSYLESLRNIGLRKWKHAEKRTGGTLSENGQWSNTEENRFNPPAMLQDRFRAFSRGVSKEESH